MQLNSITSGKTRQWRRIFFKTFTLLVFLFLLVASLAFWSDPEFFIAEKSDFYVDSGYSGYFKLGTKKHPYVSIDSAIEKIYAKKISFGGIFLKNGEYSGNIKLPPKTRLYGESKEGVVLRGTSVSPNVLLSNDASIENVSLIGGQSGVLFEEGGFIGNCLIKEFKEKGIGLLPSSALAVIRENEIFSGENKGIYIQKERRVLVIGNKIHHNQGEGIDVRDKVSGVISENEIHENSESGIELVVGGSVLDIKNNNIWDNESAGITCQYYEESPEKGKILIHSNRIKTKNPEKFTITVKSPSGGEGRIKNYWRESVTITKDNVLEGEIRKRSLDISQ